MAVNRFARLEVKSRGEKRDQCGKCLESYCLVGEGGESVRKKAVGACADRGEGK